MSDDSLDALGELVRPRSDLHSAPVSGRRPPPPPGRSMPPAPPSLRQPSPPPSESAAPAESATAVESAPAESANIESTAVTTSLPLDGSSVGTSAETASIETATISSKLTPDAPSANVEVESPVTQAPTKLKAPPLAALKSARQQFAAPIKDESESFSIDIDVDLDVDVSDERSEEADSPNAAINSSALDSSPHSSSTPSIPTGFTALQFTGSLTDDEDDEEDESAAEDSLAMLMAEVKSRVSEPPPADFSTSSLASLASLAETGSTTDEVSNTSPQNSRVAEVLKAENTIAARRSSRPSIEESDEPIVEPNFPKAPEVPREFLNMGMFSETAKQQADAEALRLAEASSLSLSREDRVTPVSNFPAIRAAETENTENTEAIATTPSLPVPPPPPALLQEKNEVLESIDASAPPVLTPSATLQPENLVAANSVTELAATGLTASESAVESAPRSSQLPAPVPPPASSNFASKPSRELPLAALTDGVHATKTTPPIRRESSIAPTTTVNPQNESRPGTGKWFAIGGVAAAAAALLAFGLSKQAPGTLVINATGPGGTEVSGIEILVDDQTRCTESPCSVELPKGSYVINARAKGFASTAKLAVAIIPGESTLQSFSLQKIEEDSSEPSAPIAANTATGFTIVSSMSDMMVSVDGAPPVLYSELASDLSSGPHTLSFSAAGYADEIQKIVIEDQALELKAPLLKVSEGTLKLEIQGLVQSDSLKVRLGTTLIPVTDGAIKLNGAGPHNLEFSGAKVGTLKKTVEFSPGEAEQTISLSFEEVASPVASKTPAPSGTASRSTSPAPTAPASSTKTSVASTQGAAGTATLNINSIPAANIILDGRPIGKTPRIGISVPAGNHTVVFVSADKGRGSQSVVVGNGQSKTVTHRF